MEIIQTVSSIFTTLLLAGIFWLCTRFISTYEDMLDEIKLPEEMEDEDA